MFLWLCILGYHFIIYPWIYNLWKRLEQPKNKASDGKCFLCNLHILSRNTLCSLLYHIHFIIETHNMNYSQLKIASLFLTLCEKGCHFPFHMFIFNVILLSYVRVYLPFCASFYGCRILLFLSVYHHLVYFSTTQLFSDMKKK